MDTTIDKNNSSYLISILYLLLIISIMLSRFLATSQSLDKIPNLDIDGNYEQKEIYDVLQLNYDLYQNDAIFKMEINQQNFIEVYVATKSTNQTNKVDYLYYYHTDGPFQVTFTLYRDNKLINTFIVSDFDSKVGIITFSDFEIQTTDVIKVKFTQNHKEKNGEFTPKYYYQDGMIY